MKMYVITIISIKYSRKNVQEAPAP